MNKLSNGLGFIFGLVIGAGAGAVVSASCCKKKYKRIADEEIESVKKAFRDSKSNPVEKIEKKIPEFKTIDRQTMYSSLVRDYTAVVTDDEEELDEPEIYISKSSDPVSSEPYIISPEDFGGREGYEMVSYICYSDGIIADETDQALSEDEVESSIGLQARRLAMTSGDDSIYVRNDMTKLDYEILPDLHPYSDVLADKKHLADGVTIMNAATQTI